MSQTVEQAREELDKKLMAGESVICPCCDQHAKIYRRAINSSQARGIIAMYQTFGTEFGYVQEVRRQQGETDNREESKLRFWGLVEEADEVRSDGGRAGIWRVTDKGEQWILCRVRVPKYALIYNNECIALEGKGTTIRDALGKKFNYRELMAA